MRGKGSDRHTRFSKGLSLPEVLVTMLVMMILATAMLPLAKYEMKKERERELKRALKTMRQAIDAYNEDARLGLITISDKVRQCPFGDTDCWPPDLKTLIEGVTVSDGTGRKKFYLRRIPKDPFNIWDDENDEAGWRLRSYQDEWNSNAWGGENVYDVYCGSDFLSTDGETYYGEW